MTIEGIIFFASIFSINLSGMNESMLSTEEQKYAKDFYDAYSIYNEMMNALLQTPEGQFIVVASRIENKIELKLVHHSLRISEEACVLREVVENNLKNKSWIYTFFNKKASEYWKKFEIISKVNDGLSCSCIKAFDEQAKISFIFDKPMSYELYEKSVCRHYKPQLQEKNLAIK